MYLFEFYCCSTVTVQKKKKTIIAQTYKQKIYLVRISFKCCVHYFSVQYTKLIFLLFILLLQPFIFFPHFALVQLKKIYYCTDMPTFLSENIFSKNEFCLLLNLYLHVLCAFFLACNSLKFSKGIQKNQLPHKHIFFLQHNS